MKIFLKKEVYFEIEVEDGTDRSLVSRAFEDIIDPAFEQLIRKIKFTKTEIDAIKGTSGVKVTVKILPKSEFLKTLNSKV